MGISHMLKAASAVYEKVGKRPDMNLLALYDQTYHDIETAKIRLEMLENALQRQMQVTQADIKAVRRIIKSGDDDRPTGSVVYFIEAIGRGTVKIGVSRDVNKRIASLQVGSSEELSLLGTVPGDVELERALHRRYSKERTSGEWFNLTARIANDIRLMLLYRETLPPPNMIPQYVEQDIPVIAYQGQRDQS